MFEFSKVEGSNQLLFRMQSPSGDVWTARDYGQCVQTKEL